MAISPYKVFAVVDRNFGEKLLTLPERVPVWIVDTEVNKPVVTRLWQERAAEDHLTGITSFKDAAASSPEDNLIARLGEIDLHHGWYSANPPYTIVEVIGTPLSERIKAEFGNYGFDDFRRNSQGFVATRPLPADPRG